MGGVPRFLFRLKTRFSMSERGGFLSTLRVLYHLALSPIRGKSHKERLESFYSKQAHGYDAFRKRLLKGRQTLYNSLPAQPGCVWVEMGGGTASNLEYLGDRIERLGSVHVVDLSGSLLKVAQERIAERGWSNVRTHEADATTFELPDGLKADVVTFSYSLTMIPDWFAAIECAERLLKPGGVIAVVDFYIARKYPADGMKRHGWWTRTFWTAWFGFDNVNLSPDHIPYLVRRFEPVSLWEGRAKVPYVPLGRVPIYRFIGRKRETA
jgi:S-adenosylmethionine-diacylgycerolhomoserine-N-methlytransferase